MNHDSNVFLKSITELLTHCFNGHYDYTDEELDRIGRVIYTLLDIRGEVSEDNPHKDKVYK